MIGEGYLEFTSIVVDSGFTLLHSCLTPTILVTVISPGEVLQIHRNNYRIHTTNSDILSGNRYITIQGHKQKDTTMTQTSYKYNLAHTLDLVLSPNKVEPQDVFVNHLYYQANKVLCHQLIYYIHTRGMVCTRQVVNGIPQFGPESDVDGCKSCFTCKTKNNKSVNGDIRKDVSVIGTVISLY